MGVLDGVQVGDYISFDLGLSYGGVSVKQVSRTTRTMVYVASDTIRFRRSDGKMMGGMRCFAKVASDDDIRLYAERVKANEKRVKVRLLLRDDLDGWSLDELTELDAFIDSVYEKRRKK